MTAAPRCGPRRRDSGGDAGRSGVLAARARAALAASLGRVGAARREAAAGRRRPASVGTVPGIVGSARRRARPMRRGSQREQPARVGMPRRAEDVAATAPRSTTSPGIHHHDVVGDLGDHAEVVGDEQHRHAELALQPRSSSRICAWMVTSSAVVGSSAMSSVGPAGERHGDHDALAHAAGELVRIVVAARRSGDGNADQVAAARSAAARASRAPSASMRRASASAIWSPTVNTGLSESSAPGRSSRSRAAHRRSPRSRDARRSGPSQMISPRCSDVGGIQPQQRQRGHALAAARFADDAEQLCPAT